MPERIVHAGETVVQSLSAVSSILVVERARAVDGDLLTYACRGCLVISEDCTRSETSLMLGELLAHMDKHVAHGHAGAKDAIWKLEACAPCRGAGTVRLSPGAAATNCATCEGSGKNGNGKARRKDSEVRRGVVVS